VEAKVVMEVEAVGQGPQGATDHQVVMLPLHTAKEIFTTPTPSQPTPTSSFSWVTQFCLTYCRSST